METAGRMLGLGVVDWMTSVQSQTLKVRTHLQFFLGYTWMSGVVHNKATLASTSRAQERVSA